MLEASWCAESIANLARPGRSNFAVLGFDFRNFRQNPGGVVFACEQMVLIWASVTLTLNPAEAGVTGRRNTARQANKRLLLRHVLTPSIADETLMFTVGVSPAARYALASLRSPATLS